MLVAALSVPDHMASWDAGMFTSYRLCPLILVVESSRKAASLEGGLAPVQPLWDGERQPMPGDPAGGF